MMLIREGAERFSLGGEFDDDYEKTGTLIVKTSSRNILARASWRASANGLDFYFPSNLTSTDIGP